jgi:RNA exonuclease 1
LLHKLQELVQPPSQVLDYRTALTGITAEQLQGVTLTRKAAAARVAQLLQPGTVLVGHSLHYDLQALQLDHQPVIDTALLFSYE